LLEELGDLFHELIKRVELERLVPPPRASGTASMNIMRALCLLSFGGFHARAASNFVKGMRVIEVRHVKLKPQ